MRYEIRELGLGGILDQAVKLTKNHFGLFLGIVGVLLIPYNVIVGFIQLSIAPKLSPNPMVQDPAVTQAILQNMVILMPLALLGAYVIIPVTNAALVHAIASEYLERSAGVLDSLKWALRRILPLFATWFLVLLAIFGGFILCIVPGILAAFWFGLATQVVIIEGTWGFAALKRSKELMTGNIGTLFVLGLLIFFINAGLLLGGNLIPQPHVQVVISSLVQGVATIFESAAVVVFYFSCRCRHEQFDLTRLAQSVGIESPAEIQPDSAQS